MAASTGNVAAGAGGGRCEIPGYPSPPGGLAGVGLAWCPASVDFQVRAFALQATGIQCSVAAVPDPPPEVVSRARSQIREVCSRGAGFRRRRFRRVWPMATLAAWGRFERYEGTDLAPHFGKTRNFSSLLELLERIRRFVGESDRGHP